MARLMLAMCIVALIIPAALSADDEPTTQPATTQPATTQPAPAQVDAEARTYQPVEDGPALLYRIAIPKLAKAPDAEKPTKLPLIIALHGAGERGDDNSKQVKHFKRLYQGPLAEKHPAIVLMPQVPTGGWWTSFPKDKDGNAPEGSPLALTRQLIDELGKDLPIDTDRIYVTGLSMGGYGTWAWMERYADITAAAVPICGGGNPMAVGKFKDVPVWAFHGEKDTVVSPDKTKTMIAALEAIGATPKVTYYPEAKHDSWTPTYKSAELYDWLFSQRLSARATE